MKSSAPAARIEAISTAVPAGEVEGHYRQWAAAQITDDRQRKLFERMADRSGISHRYTVLDGQHGRMEAAGFYATPANASTARRMKVYADEAPALALQAIAGLPDLGDVTHIVVASCTGFMAPGLDQVIARQLGLARTVERISIGFMGCYAGITALRTAAHVVRSDPAARVLVVTVELCSLHLQQTGDIEALLAMRQFADGAAAVVVSGTGPGLALLDPLSLTLHESADLITWTIGDTGFAMHLSGEVPTRLAEALVDPLVTERIGNPALIEAWAVHPGGRSILDAVERGLALAPGKLDASRAVLRDHGNMSSATVLFVLQRLMDQRPASGLALAFGPGLAMEGLRFGWTDDAG
ncbi:type III polyketide synthase [Altererythrobacter sp. KTW20L]|uniref:type III polyketide synthase n=1 Tax=Altererythrobacter sp. KTW20L TaxID=2942210 RepID=UPI0020BF8B58|nr:type III polyketide synthase [Altererythrobacter sp. KTW20L]MCL6251788.1 type III polyketide synthase [Altererythrobacter sp. KTW20L]